MRTRTLPAWLFATTRVRGGDVELRLRLWLRAWLWLSEKLGC